MKTSADISFKKTLYILLIIAFIIPSCVPAKYEYRPEETQYMNASWYGPGFHGKRTASGEVFDMHAMTAAHKSLPFGTKLRVTNVANDRTVDVTINDRGPFVAGRDIDLSASAAKKINMPGIGKVRVRYLSRDLSYVKQVKFGASYGSGPYTIQVGSFKEDDNASHLKESLKLKYDSVFLTVADINGIKHYRVRVGRFDSKNKAYDFAKTLADEGYETLVTRLD